MSAWRGPCCHHKHASRGRSSCYVFTLQREWQFGVIRADEAREWAWGRGGAREGCRGHVLARRRSTFELGWAEARMPCSVNKPCGGAPRLPCPSVMLSSQALRRACLAAHWNRGGQSVALPPRPSRFCVGKQEEQESCAKNSTETWPPGGFCGRGERGPFPLVLCNAWLSGGRNPFTAAAAAAGLG